MAIDIRQIQIRSEIALIYITMHSDDLIKNTRSLERKLFLFIYTLREHLIQLEKLVAIFQLISGDLEERIEEASFKFYRTLLRSIPSAINSIMV
jgi:hypothetical protein